MNKAERWSQALEDFAEANRPVFRDAEDDEREIAQVDDYGGLELRRGITLNKETALRLARWIQNVFSDEETPVGEALRRAPLARQGPEAP